MSRALPQFLMAALTFGTVFLLGWLGCGVLAAGGSWPLQDGVEQAWAIVVLPLLTLSTTAGALAALRLLRHRAEGYERGHFLGRVAFGAILTLLLCPVAMFGALKLASVPAINHPELFFSGVLAAGGLVAGAVGLILGLTLPLATGQR